MNKSFKFSFILIFNTVLIFSLSAQTTKILSLKLCILSAQKNHPSIQAFKKAQESKASATKSLQAQAFPGVDLTFQFEDYDLDNYKYNTLDNRLNLVWDMGKWAGRLKRLGIAAEAIAKFQSMQNRLYLILQVKQAYFSLSLAKQEMYIARLSKIYLSHHLAVTQKLFKLGQIDRLDLYFTQSELTSAREKVLSAKSKIDVWQIQLANLTGLTISPGDSLILGEFSISQNLTSDTLLYAAQQWNPALAILNQKIHLAKLQEKIIGNSCLPKLYLGGEYVLDNNPTSDGNYKILTGGLSLPIFDWGIRKNKAHALQLQSESLEATKQAFLIELRTKTQKIISRLNYFRKLVLLKDVTMQQAQKTYDYTELNYQAGIATNTEVLLAQKALIDAKVSRELIVFKLYLIKAQIDNLIGRL